MLQIFAEQRLVGFSSAQASVTLEIQSGNILALSYRVSFSVSAQRSYRASLTLICNVQLSDLCVVVLTIPSTNYY